MDRREVRVFLRLLCERFRLWLAVSLAIVLWLGILSGQFHPVVMKWFGVGTPLALVWTISVGALATYAIVCRAKKELKCRFKFN
jgi:hypothetical protein